MNRHNLSIDGGGMLCYVRTASSQVGSTDPTREANDRSTGTNQRSVEDNHKYFQVC